MKLFIQEAAENDILDQVEWYAERGFPQIARRFPLAVRAAIGALVDAPGAGTPKHTGNPRLSGLRSWPVRGFPESRVYYLTSPELLTVVRILHGKRDVAALLEDQEVETPPGA